MHRNLINKVLELEYYLYKDLPGPKHHKLQKAHKGEGSHENISYVNPVDHKSWTHLTGDANPMQIKNLLNRDCKTFRNAEMRNKKIAIKYRSPEDKEKVLNLKNKNSFLPMGLRRKIVFEKFIGNKTIEKFLDVINLKYFCPECKLILVEDQREQDLLNTKHKNKK